MISLRPGDRVFFERELKGRRIKTAAAFVGLKGERFVLTEPPMISGQPLFSAAGTPCVVRFLDRGVIFGFESRVAYVQYNPAPLLYLDYPEAVERINLRHETRLPVNLEATVAFQEGDDIRRIEGLITDLSASGCRLSLPLFFDVGDSMALSFSLGDGGQVDGLVGVARNLRTLSEGLYELGLSFERPDEAVRNYVDRLSALDGSAL